MVEAWIPLGVRLGWQEPVALKDGFFESKPALYAVASWAKSVVYKSVGNDFEVFFGACEVPLYLDHYGGGYLDHRERLLQYVESGDRQLLNAIDYLVSHVASVSDQQKLNSIAYAHNVNWHFDSDSKRLMRRVLPATQEHYLQLARSAEQSCSEYLQQAFKNAYGHNGDPSEAWVASRKAVEFLLHPIVIPKDNRATISKMTKAIQAAPHKWVSAIPADTAEQSVLKFVDLLKMMPYEPGHHGQTPGVPTAEQARTQFNLALAVCQIIVDDGFRLADS